MTDADRWELIAKAREGNITEEALLSPRDRPQAVNSGIADWLIAIPVAVFLVASLADWPRAVINASALLAGARFEALFVIARLRLARDRRKKSERLDNGMSRRSLKEEKG